MAPTRSPTRVRLAATFFVLLTSLVVTSRADTAFAKAVPRCQETQLDVMITSDGAAAGHVGDLIVIANVGANACSVEGYPTVKMSGGPSVVASVARKTKNGYLGGTGPIIAIPVVTLRAHGGAASAIVEGTDVPVGNAVGCLIFTKMSVTLPRLGPAYRFNTKFSGCSRPEVHPFVRGAKGLPYK